MTKIESLGQEKLDQLCEQWQKALRLQDWDVEVVQLDGPLDGRCAEVEFDATHRKAKVRLAGEVDEKTCDVDLFMNQERSLVHELLHLHFVALDRMLKGNELADLVLEQAINALSELLVELLQTVRDSKPVGQVQTSETTQTKSRRRSTRHGGKIES